MKLITEYLVIIDRASSEAFYHLCEKASDFNKLLQTDPEVIVEKTVIKYKNRLKFGYEVKTNKVKGKEQRFFHIRITFDGDDNDIEEYTKLLRSIRGTVHRSKGQPETLWDDVSLYYSHKAYPLIHKAENLMRKLITYFMLTTVGKEWVAEASPIIVRDAIDKSKRKQYLDVLHQIDFIHLGDFLFKAYQTKDMQKLIDTLTKAEKLEDLNLDDLKSHIGKSNWERYFSKVVPCTNEYLDTRWKALYDLRCMVAHNALVGKDEYDRIDHLVGEIEEYLQQAIDNIDKVHVPKEDREQVAENVVSNINASYGYFINLYRLFEKTIDEFSPWFGEDKQIRYTPTKTLRSLRAKDIISDEFLQEGLALVEFRNRLVHETNAEFTEQEVHSAISRLEEFNRSLGPIKHLAIGRFALQSTYLKTGDNIATTPPHNH